MESPPAAPVKTKMKRTPILLVDDDPRLIRFARANLESVGYRVIAATDGASAIKLVEAEEPDLVILDILLPGLDGFEVCKRIREFSMVPIIMLTAMAEEGDKVKGLELGADDYLTKPFGAEELLARVKALLRRAKPSEEGRQQATFSAGDLSIDFAQHKVMLQGQEVALSPTEYRLLYCLATNANRIMLHEDLLQRIWGQEYRNETEYLRVYIRYLRQKIEQDPAHPQYILSKPGIGYMLASRS